MGMDNNEKGSRILYMPGVNAPNGNEPAEQEGVDSVESCRQGLIEGQREAVKVYLRLPGTSLQNVVEDLKKGEIRIKTSNGEVPILKFLEGRRKRKPDLKSIG
jgi:hypothetical protein